MKCFGGRCPAVSHGEAKVEPIAFRDDSGQVWKLFEFSPGCCLREGFELCPESLQDIRVSEKMIMCYEE